MRLALIKNFFKTILRGFSQVMLQNNALTGLLFLLGILYNSWAMAIGALIGVLVSTLSAKLFGYNKEDIKNGLYGFNGVLVGIALVFFFELNLKSIIILILASVISSFVMKKMSGRALPPYTAPFVISTWVAFAFIIILNLMSLPNNVLAVASKLNIISALSMGLGQVMFQGSIITGIIFFIALLVNSRRVAIYGLGGSMLGMLRALLLSLPLSMLNIGLFGFNAVLCGIAFADKKKNNFLFAISAVILSVFITYGMVKLNIITLTAPFVLASWVVIFFGKRFKKI